ncbi:unnamed protein product [Plutella xylostella]|uniref:(diamondback moth) hypothetical protein n=1 Tax=Plutella xylostella TaxID=51655 RepID=A0A8S4FKJ8_PLUXY|nr:unnamed protein product [Plutella xylostella]
MFTFERLGAVLTKALHIFCPLIHAAIFSAPDEVRPLKTALGFLGGVGLGQLYYHLFLEEIPFPCHIGVWLGLAISFLLGVGIALSVQLRCVSLLLLPAGCGKAGRGVLKAVILSYVISGPITNLGLNAREVVRVFACSNELLHNLSMTKYELMRRPLADALRGLDQEIGSVKDTLRSVRDVFAPISFEMENSDEVEAIRRSLSSLQLNLSQIPPAIDEKYKLKGDETESERYQKMFEKKMEYRCQNQLAKSAQLCNSLFSSALQRCTEALPEALRVVCGPLRAAYHCDLLWLLGARPCDSHGQIDPGLGEGYEYLKKSKDYLTGDFRDVRLQYKVAAVHELNDVQDAKETGLRVIHAFEEKHNIMRIIYVVLNVCLALLCLRIVSAAITYHEMYLTSIEYDNLYVTGYFKKIDRRRAERRKHSLLPLKKMERSRYIDIHSLKYISIERQKLVNRMLKVMLEMITATTFVMLDRLFYEALAVVRAHAERGAAEQGDHDLEINRVQSGAAR